MFSHHTPERNRYSSREARARKGSVWADHHCVVRSGDEHDLSLLARFRVMSMREDQPPAPDDDEVPPATGAIPLRDRGPQRSFSVSTARKHSPGFQYKAEMKAEMEVLRGDRSKYMAMMRDARDDAQTARQMAANHEAESIRLGFELNAARESTIEKDKKVDYLDGVITEMNEKLLEQKAQLDRQAQLVDQLL